MNQELQHLLSRIREEGVDKAKAESDSILAKAKAESDSILAKARSEASALRQDAERDAAAFEQRAQDSLRQAARDVRLQLQQDLTRTLENLLQSTVQQAATTPETLQEWIAAAVTEYIKDGQSDFEIVLGDRVASLADTIVAQLQASAADPEGLKVSSSPAFPDGFLMRLEAGRVEQSFTSEAITAALARLLSPQLAKLLQQSAEHP